ncbi:hypothetical protein CHS0354_033420 [Potamilus streckersoni]|uniref:KASH domain-containing protein n=1 Tax=Potamilus streckersoni TaxID=2493646 RepID=A0AAE0VW67_9BIVA|nr:hypothetical protein CHS0354_033420 [Potamilus streckersoni]
MCHVYPNDSTIIAIKKEIDELRKDFEQCFQTKPNDQMSLKEVTDAEIENLKKEIQTLKKVFEKDEEKSKTYPETEDDKLIECLRNEVQQLRKNLEKIENSKPPVQPNYEDVIDTIRKEIETIKMEQEKNKSEINTSTAEDMAVVIELLKKEIQSINNDTEKGQDRRPTALIYEDVIRRLKDDIEKLQEEHEKRQDLEKMASLLEADLETLKSDFDTMKKEQKQICDRDKVEMYEMEINALRKEIDKIKTTPNKVELESLQQDIQAEMDSMRKEFIALREQQDKIRYQTETSPIEPCPSNVDSFETMRQEIETIKDALQKLKTNLIPMSFDPSQKNEEDKVNKTNELEAKQQKKEMRQDTKMASTIESKINELIKDMEHMKQEQEKIFIVNEEQEKQRQLDGTYIGVMRKEMDGLKRCQEKLKQHLEGRQDCSLIPNEDIIDTLRKDVDALQMEKQSLEGRKSYSLTQNEDIIDTLRKDVDALQMEKQLSNEDRRILEALRSEVDSLRKLQEQVQYQETDSSTLTPGPSDAEEPVLDTIKEGINKEYILRDAFDQLCYECKQRDEEIEACKTDIKKLFELLQISLARMDNERQTHVETINEKLAKYSESINKVLTVTKMQSEDIEKLLDDTENEKTELRAEVNKYRNLLEGITSELQQEVESLKKRYEQVSTRQQEIENLRISTEETDASTRNKLQEMSNLDNDILLRLENLNAAQEDQTEKIASLTESLEQYRSEIPTLQKAMEIEREEILDLQRGLQMHRQELREDLNNQLTALETHRKEVETKTDAIQAELQELHKVNVQQHKLKKTRQETELQDSVMKDNISSENIPVKTTVKDLGSLVADNELSEGGLQRRAKVKELEVTPTIDELIEETNDTEERSTLSSWYSAVSTRQKRKEKSNSCLGYLGRICCTALPLILLMLLFLIFALFVPFFHECCTRTNTYRHSPMFYRYVDGPPPI